jgi:hypothetical protein
MLPRVHFFEAWRCQPHLNAYIQTYKVMPTNTAAFQP